MDAYPPIADLSGSGAAHGLFANALVAPRGLLASPTSEVGQRGRPFRLLQDMCIRAGQWTYILQYLDVSEQANAIALQISRTRYVHQASTKSIELNMCHCIAALLQ